MNPDAIRQMIDAGETSRVQFKQRIDSADQLMAEMAALCNSHGGTILIGVRDKTGEVVGLDGGQIRQVSELAANVAGNNLKPPVFIFTDVVTLGGLKVLAIEVPESTDKPCMDKNGIVWVKNGADKRRVTDNNEIARLLALGGNLNADEMQVRGAGTESLDLNGLFAYCRKLDEAFVEVSDPDLERLLVNMGFMRDGVVTLAGLLLFGKNPQQFRPALGVKAVSYFGNDPAGIHYRSSKDLSGPIPRLYEQTRDFILANIHYVQNGQGFNSIGQAEIPVVAIEEALTNALIHRDYFRSASVRVLIFDNRVEIVSPGKLPNSLTVEAIRAGNAVLRNPILASVGSRIMPYRGLGSGIRRICKAAPEVRFLNDVEGEQFTVMLPRVAQPA